MNYDFRGGAGLSNARVRLVLASLLLKPHEIIILDSQSFSKSISPLIFFDTLSVVLGSIYSSLPLGAKPIPRSCSHSDGRDRRTCNMNFSLSSDLILC
jgi:hypothetical protein